MVTTDLGDQDYGHAVVLRPNGRIIVAGSSGANFVRARPRHTTLEVDREHRHGYVSRTAATGRPSSR